MKVLFDHRGFEEMYGGVSRYFSEIMKRLPRLGVECILPCACTVNRYLHEPPFNVPLEKPSYNDFFRNRHFRGKWRLWRALQRFMPCCFPDYGQINRRRLRDVINKGDFDLFHATAPHLYGEEWKLVKGKKPIVVTVHDLLPEISLINSGNWGINRQYARHVVKGRKEILSAAYRIIAVSEHTKRDLIQFYGIEPNRIHVIYHGSGGRIETVKKAHRFDYILYVGKKAGYKNFKWFKNAVKPLKDRGIKIVCTDGNMSEEELRCAYQGALAFVYPSWYEGFGIPLLEAWANGCPVVCARASCFPEIAGDAAEFFNVEGCSCGMPLLKWHKQVDKNEGDDLRRILRVLSEDKYKRNRLIQKGYERLRAFNWDRTTAETVKVYES